MKSSFRRGGPSLRGERRAPSFRRASGGPSLRAAWAARWWRQSDSDRRHSACKADALPTELCPHWRGRRGPAAFRSVLEDSSFRFGRRGGQALRAMCRRVRAPTVSGRAQNRRIDHRNSRSLGVRLLRKEVIQPQVPLRLPCYDFIPITTHTLDGSPLADGPPASGADGFHDVTGGVYKARERIHGTNC